MIIDPSATAGLVAREVRTGTRDGMTTRTTVARRTFATDRDDLWDAVTNPQRLPRWFLPVSGELEPGGNYALEGNASGTVERCDPPESFAITWEFAGQISWVEVALLPAEDGTTLELAHEAPLDPDAWAQFGPGAGGVGWDLGLLGLGLHLDSGEALDPAEAQAWPLSPEGQAFIERSASDWAEAAIADGDEPDAARQAARNTTGFYTGTGEH